MESRPSLNHCTPKHVHVLLDAFPENRRIRWLESALWAFCDEPQRLSPTLLRRCARRLDKPELHEDAHDVLNKFITKSCAEGLTELVRQALPHIKSEKHTIRLLIHAAIPNGQENVTRVLCDTLTKSNIKITQKDYTEIQSCAARAGFWWLVQRLIPHVSTPDESVVVLAATHGRHTIIRELLQHIKDLPTHKAMLECCRRGDIMSCLLLMYFESFDIHAEDDALLRIAHEHGHTKLVEGLLAHGAHPDALVLTKLPQSSEESIRAWLDKYPWLKTRATHVAKVACEHNHAALLKTALCTMDPTCPFDDIPSLLDIAVKHDSPDCAQWLLEIHPKSVKRVVETLLTKPWFIRMVNLSIVQVHRNAKRDALWRACESGDLACVRAIDNVWPSTFRRQEELLKVCIQKGFSRIVRVILERWKTQDYGIHGVWEWAKAEVMASPNGMATARVMDEINDGIFHGVRKPWHEIVGVNAQ